MEVVLTQTDRESVEDPNDPSLPAGYVTPEVAAAMAGEKADFSMNVAAAEDVDTDDHDA